MFQDWLPQCYSYPIHTLAYKAFGMQWAEWNYCFGALPSKIDVLKSIEVGLNQNPAETYDVVLTAVVSTLDEVGIYAKHPAHVAAAGIIGGHVEVRACVDYEC